jgi:hypothetical protein
MASNPAWGPITTGNRPDLSLPNNRCGKE